MRGQAVHEEGVGLRRREHPCRDCVRAHPPDAGRGLLLLPHAGPDVRVDYVGPGHRLHRVGRELELRRAALGLELRPDPLLGLVPLWAGQRDPHPEEAGPKDPGIGHVEARVPEKGDLAALERGDQVAVGASPPLGGRECVRVDLAGVQEVREPVDDRDSRGRGQPLHLGVVIGADDDPVDKAGEDARGVLDRLAPSQLEVVPVQVDGVAPQLVDPDLEGHAGAGARFRKEEGPGLPGKHRRGVPTPFPLEVAGEREHLAQLRGLQVGLFEEVLHRMKRS